MSNDRLSDDEIEAMRENARDLRDIYATQKVRTCAEDLPRALDEVERLRAENERLHEAIDATRNVADQIDGDCVESGWAKGALEAILDKLEGDQ